MRINQKNKFLILILLILLITPSVHAAQSQLFNTFVPNYTDKNVNQDHYNQTNTVYDPYQLSPLQGKITIIPAMTTIPAVTTLAYSAKDMVLGQTFNLVLPNNYYYNNNLVIPAGSTIQGSVIMLKKPGFGTRNGQLKVKFNNIVTPNGQNIPISGIIKTTGNSGIIYGGTKLDTSKEYAKDLGIGAAGGALAGTVMGAVSQGKIGRGAALGTAIGAGIGLGKSLLDKGGNIEIPANSIIEVILEQPTSVLVY